MYQVCRSILRVGIFAAFAASRKETASCCVLRAVLRTSDDVFQLYKRASTVSSVSGFRRPLYYQRPCPRELGPTLPGGACCQAFVCMYQC